MTILSRDPAKAETAAKALGGMKGGDSNRLKDYLPECTLFINGSPLGMKGSPDYQDFSFFGPAAEGRCRLRLRLQASGDTLLREARARGIYTVDGMVMLLTQMGVLFETLTGITPDEEVTKTAMDKVEAILRAGE